MQKKGFVKSTLNQNKCEGCPLAFQLVKKPRRVRTRRCEKNEICFFRRRVRREKHFSARKCARCPLIGSPLQPSEAVAVGRGGATERYEDALLRRALRIERSLSRRSARSGLQLFSKKWQSHFFDSLRWGEPLALPIFCCRISPTDRRTG